MQKTRPKITYRISTVGAGAIHIMFYLHCMAPTLIHSEYTFLSPIKMKRICRPLELPCDIGSFKVSISLQSREGLSRDFRDLCDTQSFLKKP